MSFRRELARGAQKLWAERFDLLALLGAVLVLSGLARISLTVALIVAGAGLIGWGVLGAALAARSRRP